MLSHCVESGVDASLIERTLSMAPRRRHPAIVFVFGFLPYAALAPSLSGCNKPAVPVAGPSPAAESVGKPLTDEECLAAGEEISEAVSSGDVAAFDRMIDWDSVNQRCTAGIDAPEPFRQGFIRGLNQSRLKVTGISNGLVDAVKKGGSYTLLHSHTRENRRWLLFRLLTPESGVNYHDLLLARRPDGKIKAVDMYVYMTGELISQTYRRGYLQAVARGSGGLVDRLTGADQEYAKNLKKLSQMVDAGRSGRTGEVLSIYEGLPSDLKKDKNVLMIRLQAAQKLGDDGEYSQSIEDYRAKHPNDASIDIISIDYYVLKKRHREALVCLDRVDHAVQGDPYLQTLRAGIHIEQNDLTAARADLKKALDAEPGLVDAYWTLVTLSLKGNDHDETLKMLRLIRDKFSIEVGDLTTVPLYEEFIKSPQYQEWRKENPGPAERPPGKEPAEDPKK
jgi:tetratricopeptide (TPR) repeat protein